MYLPADTKRNAFYASGYAKWLKLLISILVGYILSILIGHGTTGTSMATSIILVTTTRFTQKSSRIYFRDRVFAQFVGYIVSFAICYLLAKLSVFANGSALSIRILELVVVLLSVAIIHFVDVKIGFLPQWYTMPISICMMVAGFVVGSTTVGNLRILQVIIGMIFGILINQFVLSEDYYASACGTLNSITHKLLDATKKDESLIICMKFVDLAPIKADIAKMELKLKRTVEDKNIRFFDRYRKVDLSLFIYLHTLARKLAEAFEVAQAHGDELEHIRDEFKEIYLYNMENILKAYTILLTDAYSNVTQIPPLDIKTIAVTDANEIHLLNSIFQFEKAYRNYTLPAIEAADIGETA